MEQISATEPEIWVSFWFITGAKMNEWIIKPIFVNITFLSGLGHF